MTLTLFVFSGFKSCFEPGISLDGNHALRQRFSPHGEDGRNAPIVVAVVGSVGAATLYDIL
jgi:hypothetical protein